MTQPGENDEVVMFENQYAKPSTTPPPLLDPFPSVDELADPVVQERLWAALHEAFATPLVLSYMKVVYSWSTRPLPGRPDGWPRESGWVVCLTDTLFVIENTPLVSPEYRCGDLVTLKPCGERWMLHDVVARQYQHTEVVYCPTVGARKRLRVEARRRRLVCEPFRRHSDGFCLVSAGSAHDVAMLCEAAFGVVQ